MIPLACAREKELAELLRRGCWPQASAAELRVHVAGCRRCGELVVVMEAFQRARAGAMEAAPMHAPGALWWRTQLRRRNAAIERIGRPLLGAQIFAFAVALMVGGGFLLSQARQGMHWMAWLGELPRSLHWSSLWPAVQPGIGGGLMALVEVLATLALVSGVVVYLASEKR